MSKKIKILLAVIAAVVVLTVGGGVAVLAADATTTPTTTTTAVKSNPLYAKVAAILGITEQKLTDAFTQARTGIANTETEALLDKAVAAGTITAAEKATIKEWLAKKPTTNDREAMRTWMAAMPKITKAGFINSLLGAPGRMNRIMPMVSNDEVNKKVAAILGITEQKLTDAFTQAQAQLKVDNFNKMLEKAVTDKRITQAEADQIKAWWGQKPAAADKVMPGLGAMGQGPINGGLKDGRLGGRIGGGMMRLQQCVPGITAR